MLQHVISNSLRVSVPGEKELEKDYYTILANADKETSADVLKFKIMELFFPEEAAVLAETERESLSENKANIIKEENKQQSETQNSNINNYQQLNISSKNSSQFSENQTVSIENLLQTDIPDTQKISPLEALLRNQAHLQMEALKFKQKSEDQKKAEKELESIPAIEQNLALMNEESQMEQEMISLQDNKLDADILEDF